MCGLTGYFNFNGVFESSSLAVREMLTLQKHRGPDDSGILGINTTAGILQEMPVDSDLPFTIKPDLVFGFNRLSILDLSVNGHQPMISADGKVALMMNGEIYNAFDYKDELTAKGHRFKSTTDTEIVLALYKEYGMEQMLKRLNGMFAIAIYDFQLKRLFLARDRVGIKPLYVLREKDRIAFSSEMKSFKALPGFKFQLDDTRMNEFLIFRNLVNNTLFQNIVNCTPGTYLSIDPNGEVIEHHFYNINDEGQDQLNISNAVHFLEEALKNSVERQMMSDVKLGSQLSGGVDSSLVTWYAAKSLEEGQLETFSIVFDNEKVSEEKYINQVSELLLLKAHKYTLDADYYFAAMEKATWHFEQPLNHPNTIGIYLLSQEARKHVTVLLSGEGADELLAGYGWFLQMMQSPYLKKHFLGKLKQNKNSLLPFLRYYTNNVQRMVMGSAFGTISTAAAVLENFNLQSGLKERTKVLQGLNGEKLLKYRKYEMLTYLPDLLMRQDKMSMAHSIENRVPFLDNQMISASLKLNQEDLIGFKNGKAEGKFALKEICAAKMGESFAYRSKMGFGIPLKEFMSSASFQKKWNNEILPGIIKRQIFSSTALNTWMKNLTALNSAQLDMLWLMTGFEIWAKQYLD